MNTTTQAPHHKTTIRQDRGIHSYDDNDGLPLRAQALFDIVTYFHDYSHASWESLSADDQESWDQSIADVHAARVERASLKLEHRHRAEFALSQMVSDGPAGDAEAIRRAIAETAE